MMGWRNRLIHRSGISTIVGTLIFLVIMLGAFVAFATMMETNNEIFRNQLKIANQEILKIQEKYVVSACTDSDDSNRLKVFVENTGDQPIEMTDFFIINKTETTRDVTHYDVKFDDSFVPVRKIVNILENQELTMESTPNTYDLKLVSVLGNSKIISLPVADPNEPDERLQIRLLVEPPEIINAGNVTVIMHAYNRGNHTLYDVQPNGNPSVDPDAVAVQGIEITKPISIKRLDPDEDSVFIWNYEIFGPVGTKANFTAQAKAKLCADTSTFDVLSAFNTTFAKIAEEQDPASVGPVEPFSTPKLFLSYPNPFGDDLGGGDGNIAITIANPTNQTLLVSQVGLFILNPKGDSIFTSPIVSNDPTTGTWTIVPGDNFVYWTDNSSPIQIPKYNTETWTVEIDPGAPAGGQTPLNQIFVNAYTSFGQVAETTQSIGAEKEPGTIVQVYQSRKSDLSDTRMFYNITGLVEESVTRFNFTIENAAVSDKDESILAQSFMLINIPTGFEILTSTMTVDDNNDTSGALIEAPAISPVSEILIFDDGSQLIPIEIIENMEDGEIATFSVAIKLPDIDEDHMYLFHIGTNGTAEVKCSDSGTCNPLHLSTIGSQAATIVQVCTTASDCPQPP